MPFLALEDYHNFYFTFGHHLLLWMQNLSRTDDNEGLT
jgi:hypothetical protein